MDEKLPSGPPPSYESAAQPPPVSMGAPGSRASKSPLPRVPLPLDLPALNALRNKKVVLASASPRRRQLLAQIGLDNLVIHPSSVAENLPKSLSPFEYVRQTASQKALSVYSALVNTDPGLIIAADTVVVSHDGKILEKPRSEAEHVAMLKVLRDTGAGWHRVYTAVVCVAPLVSARDPGYALESEVEETRVRFDLSVTDDLISAYVRTREGADKAGGYGIQGMGSILVEKIEGTHDNVVGLPLRATLRLIEKVMKAADDEEIVDEFADGEDEEE